MLNVPEDRLAPSLHVHLVLSPENSGWIIQKMAERIAEFAGEFNARITISDKPDPNAAINHWMSYAFANVPQATPATMMITHLDDLYKINLVKSELQAGIDIGICISSHHRQFLIDNEIPAQSLAYIVPGHDFVAKPRRIVVGLTTRVYPDGRKREFMLEALAGSVRLDALRFRIFGSGWEKVIPKLQAAGAEVDYYPGTDDYAADYQDIVDAIPDFDYYLYLGRDEGSLGTLDALAAGVKTIVAPQGFHCDLPYGITHSFWDQDELNSIFLEIITGRNRRCDAVSQFSWREYSRQHILLWLALSEGRASDHIDRMLESRVSVANSAVRHESKVTFYRRMFSYRRILSAFSHVPILHGIRNRWRSRK
jgi:hypothetical protein